MDCIKIHIEVHIAYTTGIVLFIAFRHQEVYERGSIRNRSVRNRSVRNRKVYEIEVYEIGVYEIEVYENKVCENEFTLTDGMPGTPILSYQHYKGTTSTTVRPIASCAPTCTTWKPTINDSPTVTVTTARPIVSCAPTCTTWKPVVNDSPIVTPTPGQ
ncbi:hypothetical protein Bhyg_05697 [Pseudolycoriella hygida]|uniref:Uncharacterized protein n=1 Tax=Pseudolycoriella hygida TaxID=35572 RepID=A0A9Q0S251_9DIPT|nr:hypothetical protein Bhyg_05697 [Pseudolycoriella hygida]